MHDDYQHIIIMDEKSRRGKGEVKICIEIDISWN